MLYLKACAYKACVRKQVLLEHAVHGVSTASDTEFTEVTHNQGAGLKVEQAFKQLQLQHCKILKS